MGYGVRLVNETDTVIRLVDEPSDEVEVVKPFEPMAEADYEELTASEAPEDEAHAPLVDFDRWSPLAEMPFRLIGLLLVWSALFVAPFMALFVCFFSPYLIVGSSTPLRFIVLCFLVGPPVMLVLGSMPGLLPDRLSDEPRYLARLFRWKAFVVSWTGAWTLFYAGEWHPLPPHDRERVFGLGLFVGVTLLLAWLGGALSKRAFESEEPIVSMPWGMILGPAFLALVSVWMLGASSSAIPAIPWVRPPATQLPPALPMESFEEGAHAQADRALMLLRVEPPVTERNDAAVSGHRFEQVWSAAERFLNAYVFKEGRKAPSSEVGTFVFTNARQRLIRSLEKLQSG